MSGLREMAWSTIQTRAPSGYALAVPLLCRRGESFCFSSFIHRRARWRLLPAALAVLAPRPTAGPALAFLQLLLSSADAALSGRLLLGIVDPTDELVARQGRDVLPGSERRAVGDQRRAQVCRQLVHHAAGHSLAAHAARITPATIDPIVSSDSLELQRHQRATSGWYVDRRGPRLEAASRRRSTSHAG